MDSNIPHGMNTMYQQGQGRPAYPDFSNSNSQYGQQGAHTLPPIQPQRPAYSHPQSYGAMGRQQQHPAQSMYPSYGSPNVSQSPYASSMNQYSQAPYSQGPPQSSMAHDYQYSQSHGLPNIRPMPAGSAPGAAHGYHMQHPIDDYQSRTHVVGSQGRRGILPSDEGRPAAPLATGNGSSAKNAAIPPKDADGKYPCPHCTKTYLHAKHLKRHLLRHTGDRPYSCVLCSDTFSRSDILKRHFQKCSIRRGNPTGATHLSNSQSHLKKQQAKKAASGSTTETGFPTAPHTPTSVTYGESTQGLGMSHIPVGNIAQGLSSRSDHDRHPFDEGKRSLTASTLYRSGHNSLPSSGSSTPLTGRMPQTFTPESSTHTRVNSFSQQGYAQSSNQSQQGLTSIQNPSNLDFANWNQLKHRDNPQLPSPHQEQSMQHTTEQPHGAYMNFNGSYNGGEAMNWRTQESSQYHRCAQRLTLFCQLDPGSIDPHDQLLNFCIQAEKIEHFLQCWTVYDLHWPLLHLATFNPLDAYDGSILAMICIGAVYSDKIGLQQARNLLRKAQNLLSQKTEVAKWLGQSLTSEILERRHESLLFEELFAIQIVEMVSLWHSEQDMRDKALRKIPRCTRFAFEMGWFETPREHTKTEEFDWRAWIAQETRIRKAFIWYLGDCALNLFCNSPPTIDPLDVKLPLPCSDAAWSAKDADSCATALGLNSGSNHGNAGDGLKIHRELELHVAVRALLNPNYDIQSGSTSIFAKFILIHTLMVQIWKARRKQLSVSSRSYAMPADRDLELSGIVRLHDSEAQANLEQSSFTLLSATEQALGKFKKIWDEDLAMQYSSQPRIGFVRDAIVYYWLARMLLRNTTISDWYANWQSRFPQILQTLKQVRTWVSSDAASRGEDIGSVAAIDENYATTDQSFNMRLLFAPMGLPTSTT